MRYVLDSNVVIKCVLPEAFSETAITLLEESRHGVHEFLAPDVFPVEAAHALTKAMRQGRISREDADVHLANILLGLPALYPSLPVLARAFELSINARIGVYDCLYVALAERECCELLTADDRLKRSLPSLPIMLLADLS